MGAVEDEGILDLRELTSVPPASIAPMWTEAAPEAPASAPRAKRTTAIAIAAAAAGTLVVLGAAAFAFRGPTVKHVSAADPPAVTAAALPAPATTTPPVAAPTPAAPAASTDTTAAADATSSSDAPAPKHGKGKRRHASQSIQATHTPATTRAPKASRGADPCGCHGSLDCALRCAAAGK